MSHSYKGRPGSAGPAGIAGSKGNQVNNNLRIYSLSSLRNIIETVLKF